MGIEGTNIGAPNSMPSGHMTVAASVVVATVLVLPPRLRGTVALLGAAYAALTGIATLSAGWHRPSDAVAAVLVVGAWGAAAGFLLVLAGAPDEAGDARDAHPYAVAALALIGVGLLLAGGAALGLTDQGRATAPVDLGRARLATAYAGSASGVAGATCLVVALVLATVHRVVPRRSLGTPTEGAPRLSTEPEAS